MYCQFDCLKVLPNLQIGKPYKLNTLPGNLCCAIFIILNGSSFIMLTTVQFYG